MNCRSCAASAAPLPPPPQQSGAQKRRSAPRSCSSPLSGAAHQNARAPRNGVSKGSGYSSIVLYINSSSSRASHFCGQGQFVQCWRGVAQLQSLCGGLHKGRGSETTTSGHRLFVWITVQLCQNCYQCYPQRVPVGKLFHPTKHKARGPWRTPGFVRQEEREPPPTLEPPPASGRPHEGIYFAGAACGC